MGLTELEEMKEEGLLAPVGSLFLDQGLCCPS